MAQAQQIPANSVWSAMSYTPPRGRCNHKASLLAPACPCLRFMLHPVKAATSFECDGCAHHASFHSLENAAEDAVLKKWAVVEQQQQQQQHDQQQQAASGARNKKRKLLTQTPAAAAEQDDQEVMEVPGSWSTTPRLVSMEDVGRGVQAAEAALRARRATRGQPKQPQPVPNRSQCGGPGGLRDYRVRE